MKGYTLIELIIALSIFSCIMVSIFHLSFSVAQTAAKLTERSDTLQDARIVLDFIAEEMSRCSVYGLKRRDYLASYFGTGTEVFEGIFEGLKLKTTADASNVSVFFYEQHRDGVFTGALYYGGGTVISTTAQLIVSGIDDFTISADPKTEILTLKVTIGDFTIVRKISLRYKIPKSYSGM